MPEPASQSRDPIRPLLGVGTCAFFYWVLTNLLVPIGRYLGGEMIAITVPPLIAAAVASALAMAIFESRHFVDLGLAWESGTARNLLTGLGLGAGSALLVILPPATLGLARYEWIPNSDFSWRAIFFLPILLFCGALGEEIMFRGFILQFLVRGYRRALGGYGPALCIVTLGALFGLLHGLNPNATPPGMINTALFGILFGAAVLRTHDLWLPLGLHFGWNVMLPLLGVELSGLTIRVTGYRLVWKSGTLLSGGAYGPEAGILCSAVLILLALAVWKVPVHRGRAYLLDHSDSDLPEAGSDGPELPSSSALLS